MLDCEPLGSSLVAGSPGLSEGLMGAPVCCAPRATRLEGGSEGV